MGCANLYDQLLSGKRDGKYSPLEVAQRLEDYAQTAREKLAQAKTPSMRPFKPESENSLPLSSGAGCSTGIYEKTGDPAAFEASLAQYRKARVALAALANEAKGVYMSDITVGEHPQLRGHWLDRLPAIDRDIAGLAAKLESAKAGATQPRAAQAMNLILSRRERRGGACRHVPPAKYRRDQPATIECGLKKPGTVSLFYQHVNQAERYTCVAMDAHTQFSATIPATYTDSPYPLEYYFEIAEAAEKVWLHPGFSPDLTNQPYFVVRQA